MTAPARRRQQRPEGGPIALAAAILRGSANLHGARCVDYVGEFDVDQHAEDLGYRDERERWEFCQVVCRACPARASCWSWADGLTGHRKPAGPLATTTVNPFPITRAQRARHQHTEPVAEAEPPGPPPSTPTRSRGARARIKPNVNRNRKRSRR